MPSTSNSVPSFRLLMNVPRQGLAFLDGLEYLPIKLRGVLAALQESQRLSDHLVLLESGDLLKRGIHVRQPSVGPGNDDDLACVIDRPGKLLQLDLVGFGVP